MPTSWRVGLLGGVGAWWRLDLGSLAAPCSLPTTRQGPRTCIETLVRSVVGRSRRENLRRAFATWPAVNRSRANAASSCKTAADPEVVRYRRAVAREVRRDPVRRPQLKVRRPSGGLSLRTRCHVAGSRGRTMVIAISSAVVPIMRAGACMIVWIARLAVTVVVIVSTIGALRRHLRLSKTGDV